MEQTLVLDHRASKFFITISKLSELEQIYTEVVGNDMLSFPGVFLVYEEHKSRLYLSKDIEHKDTYKKIFTEMGYDVVDDN